jgi:hypothetical protein
MTIVPSVRWAKSHRDKASLIEERRKENVLRVSRSNSRRDANAKPLLPGASHPTNNLPIMSSPPPALPTTNLLASKTIVITGSSRGIGRACAIECARNGADVVLHHYPDDLSRKEVAEMGEEIEKVGRKSVAVEGVCRNLLLSSGLPSFCGRRSTVSSTAYQLCIDLMWCWNVQLMGVGHRQARDRSSHRQGCSDALGPDRRPHLERWHLPFSHVPRHAVINLQAHTVC